MYNILQNHYISTWDWNDFTLTKKIKRKNIQIKCEYFLVSFLLYDSKLNTFALWRKQDYFTTF